MAWEYRNGRQYYYRKRRESGRVVSEYIGGGLVATIVEGRDMEERWRAEQERAELMKAKADATKLDKQIREAEELIRTITRAYLLLAGYHAPRRQWRKVRT